MRRSAWLALAVPVLASGTLIASAPGSPASGAATAVVSPAAPRLPRLTPAFPGNLVGVAATSASNAWAVGNDGFSNTQIVHWNGKAWRQVANQRLKGGGSSMLGVAALSATNASAVGQVGAKALIEHWNGRAWRQVTVPAPASAKLLSVAASAADDVWAVGEYFYGPTTSAAC